MIAMASPASAAEVAASDIRVDDSDNHREVATGQEPSLTSADPWSRRYRRNRHGRHYGHYYRRHDRRGTDIGDVLRTVLVIGAVAAIVDAVDGDGDGVDDDDRRRERDRDWQQDRDGRYNSDDAARDSGRDAGRDADWDRDDPYSRNGFDNAIDICVDQVERGDTVVDALGETRRAPDGWRVTGRLTSGEGWDCWIDNDGRIRQIDIGAPDVASGNYASGDYSPSGYAYTEPAPGQWSSADYARARSAVRTPIGDAYSFADKSDPGRRAALNTQQPASPGRSLPAEAGVVEIDGDLE
jgi:hypothetical protein